jgi:hypothetical protein
MAMLRGVQKGDLVARHVDGGAHTAEKERRLLQEARDQLNALGDVRHFRVLCAVHVDAHGHIAEVAHNQMRALKLVLVQARPSRAK